MQAGGDRGKAPNKTGTQPKGKKRQNVEKPGHQEVQAGAGKGIAGTKHAAERTAGARTSETRKAGPKKVPAKTTTRSGDK